jgi:uncharacterized membrane protein
MKLFSLKENITELLAIISTLGSFLFLILLAFKPIPEVNKDLLNILGGVVIGTTLGGVFGYFFGQSKKRDIPIEDKK